jgi:hypothetical protein
MRRARAGLTVYPPKSSKNGRCPLSFSAGSSKIKIWTSSSNKTQLALCHDEVRILIFDDPAENERGKYPQFRFAQVWSSRYRSTAVDLLVRCKSGHPTAVHTGRFRQHFITTADHPTWTATTSRRHQHHRR